MSVPKYETIANYLLSEIQEGRLKSGDRVMSEKELAELFGVSTMTTKGAMSRLAALGVIVRGRKRGSYVADPLPDLSRQSPVNHNLDTANDKRLHDRLVGFMLESFAGSFGGKMLDGIERRCAELGLHLVLRQTYGNRAVEDEAIQSLLRLGAEGIIVFPVHGEHYNKNILRMVLDDYPVVLVDRYLKGIPTSSVYTDNVQAATDLTNHVLDLGHRHIGFISPPPDSTSSIVDRTLGFTQALAARNLPVPPNAIYSNVHSTLAIRSRSNQQELVKDDIRQLVAFMKAHPEITAYVACEYDIAHLVKLALGDLGKRVPDDITIVCFDHAYHPLEQPFFTHIRQDEEAIGRTAVDCLARRMTGEEDSLDHQVPYHLIVCRSDAPVGENQMGIRKSSIDKFY